ncbi:glycosyltransferase [Candidatus Parcubacteria bacterium]|nr:glycosyltransferase [Candidatus Parcubacteria bacterium]
MRIAIITRFGMPLTEHARGYYYRPYYLANRLTERGHDVTVLAHPDTKTKARLIKAKVKKMEWEIQLMTYSDFIKNYADEFDIINAQTDHLCCFFSQFIKTPILHTIIFGGFWGQVEELLRKERKQYFSTNSYGTKNRYPYLNWQGVVHNGFETKQFKFNNKPDDYLLFLSRVRQDKGVEEAILAAKATGQKLIIAGQAADGYLQKTIKPMLTKNITYFGVADFQEKIKLFKNAKALLHPHLVPESFGNSMVEAQACGTPVIVYPHGSSSEVVANGRTGFIVKDINGIKKAIKKINKIKRADCRAFVEKNFTIEKMVDGYEKLYEKVIKKRKK